MGKSLQDQLLKAGLVNKEKVKKVNQEKRKKEKLLRKNNQEIVDENKVHAQQVKTEKAERDRELNRKKQQESQQKAIQAQISQLITVNRQSRKDGDITFNFSDNNKIKKIYVTKELQDQLSKGHLAIVKLEEQYELVPTTIAEKIQQRDEQCVLFCQEAPEEVDEDDPYADYQIPDDLMW